MDLSDYQKAIDTSAFFVSKGNVETALKVVQEALKILYLEKETDELEDESKHDEIEILLTKKYLAIKAEQEKLQKRHTYFRTFIHTTVVCLVILVFMFIGSRFAKKYTIEITDTVTNRLENKIKSKLSPEKLIEKAKTFYGNLDKMKKLKILAVIKQNPELFYQLSLMQEKNGNIDNAISKLEWALYLSPDNAKFKKKLKDLNKKLLSNSDQKSKG